MSSNLFIDNKYTKWYYEIINSALNRTPNGYTEKHRIIPGCMGGKYVPGNVVHLTAREHFVCHLLLTRMITKEPYLSKLKYAAILLYSVHDQKISSRLYEVLKSNIKQTPEWIEKRTSKRIGQKHSIETKKILSNKAKVREIRYVTCLSCRKTMDYGNYCKSHGEKCGIKQSTAWNKGKTMSTKGRVLPKRQCPYCEKEADAGNYRRWHGENCKWRNVS